MNWTEEVKLRLKRKNQVLFSKNSAILQDVAALIAEQSHRTMVLWALEFAEESADLLKTKYPGETRPLAAVSAAAEWAAGRIKMKTAQRKILDCHAFAKEIVCKEDIALCHAVGQACSVVHTAGHSIGYPVYDLTAIVYRSGGEEWPSEIEARVKKYIERILYRREHLNDYSGEWAHFLKD